MRAASARLWSASCFFARLWSCRPCDARSSRSTTDARRTKFDFADLAGDDDERKIELALLDRLERREAAVARKHIIGEDEIPPSAVEGLLERGRGLHAFKVELVPALLQMPNEDERVLLMVFEQKHTERCEGRRYHTAGGGSFRSSQYMPICRTASVNWSKSTGLRM